MRKLGRKKSNKEHLLRNLATSLVLYETIDTTEAKAKEVKIYLERIIARNKVNDLSAKREIFSKLFDKKAAQKLVNELYPRYKERKSGFIRSFHMGNRLGDNAPIMRLELIDKKIFIEEKTKEQAKKPGTDKMAKIAAGKEVGK
jgi:large subunit ribosomal protein L17